MEKKKEMADREDNNKEKAKVIGKKVEDFKKKRQERKGNQPCRTHHGTHLWKDCPNNLKNKKATDAGASAATSAVEEEALTTPTTSMGEDSLEEASKEEDSLEEAFKEEALAEEGAICKSNIM